MCPGHLNMIKHAYKKACCVVFVFKVWEIPNWILNIKILSQGVKTGRGRHKDRVSTLSFSKKKKIKRPHRYSAVMTGRLSHTHTCTHTVTAFIWSDCKYVWGGSVNSSTSTWWNTFLECSWRYWKAWHQWNTFTHLLTNKKKQR